MSDISQIIKQDQKLIMSLAMQRALTVLQMPLNELSEWLFNELEQNPVFDVQLPTTCSEFPCLQKRDSLYEYLEKEIFLHFEQPHEREIAMFIAGSLNSKGFITLSEKEICDKLSINIASFHRIIKKFQQIEPIGLGANDVQEALLLQLIDQGKERTQLYQLISKYFDDLLHNRLHLIAKSMHLSIQTIKKLIQKEIRYLNPFPGHHFNREMLQKITPDLIIDKEEENWKVEVYAAGIPEFHIHPHYAERLEHKELTKAELNFIRQHLASGKWLLCTLDRRKKILIDIGAYIVKKQQEFLEGVQIAPLPLTRKELAYALRLSESTVTRAIYQKYVITPQGFFPLSAFFTHTIQTASGIISNQEAKSLLLKLIQHENKQIPLSDQDLSEMFYAQGIPCARRTIAKYRKELQIGSKYQRKEWN